jgi:hypothetical protein
MKKMTLVVTFLFCAIACFSQIKIDGVDITQEVDAKYVQIIAIGKFMSRKITINVDYGQEIKLGQDMRIEGPDGKAQVFNSITGALNFFVKHGYEYVDAIPVFSEVSGSNVYRFLLRRKDE